MHHGLSTPIQFLNFISMKKLIPLLLALLTFFQLQAQVMTFDNGAIEPGFSFTGWNSASGTIWVADLASTSMIEKTSGIWNFSSFDVGPFVGENQMLVVSDLGDSLEYDANIDTTYNLNWIGISSVTFSRISGSGASSDIDNIVYDTVACNQPVINNISAPTGPFCVNQWVELVIDGTLNAASAWHVYKDACGGVPVGTTTGAINVLPTESSTVYFIRGEDGAGCIDESSGGCMTFTLNVTEIDTDVVDAAPVLTAVEGNATYQWLDCNDNFTEISSEESQAFIAAANGSYAVELNLNGCVDTSACITVSDLSIGDNDGVNEFSIYPNPSQGEFQIRNMPIGITQYEMLDLNGRTVNYGQVNNSGLVKYADLKPGIYMVRLLGDTRSIQTRLVVE